MTVFKLNIRKDRKEIARIISINLGLMVEKKNKKGIIIREPIVQDIADCIIAYLIGALKEKSGEKE